MARQSFRIRLVEGEGEGTVADGDPAFTLCLALRKAGFTDIVLSLTTLATGKISEKLLQADMADDETFERMAGYSEQASYVMEETECVHHYILSEPAPNTKDTGTCKWCGNVREYDRFTEISWSSDEARMRTYALREWELRLSEEEDLIGIGHNRDSITDEKPKET